MTLKPAEAAARVGMSETELRSINQIPPRMLIKAGSTLLVRRSAGLNRDVAERVADNGYLALAPEIVLKRTVVKAGKKDSVSSMALRYRVRAQDIAQWNKIAANASLKPGQPVVLFLATAAARAPAKSSTAKSSKPVARRVRTARK